MTPSRLALYLIPALSVLVVAFALFVVGAPRPYVAGRLYGGPTEGQKSVTGWLEVVRRNDGRDQLATGTRVRILATTRSGGRAQWTGLVDSRGMAPFSLAVAGESGGLLEFVVDDLVSGKRLAAGPVQLGVERWRRAARRRGGWLPVKSSGALSVRVAPSRGIWAIPFFDPIVIAVSDNATPVVGATVDFVPEGLRIRPDVSQRVTDSQGMVVAHLAPREHATALRVTAQTNEGKTGTWYGTLPVLPGALHAQLFGEELRIESPIPRAVAYYSLVNETGRHAGGAVELHPNDRGGASGRVRHKSLPPGPLWAVVSSEAELNNTAAIGWPLRTVGQALEYTFDVPDQLLLDGLVAAEGLEAKRRRQARWLALAVCFLSAVLIAILFTKTVQSSSATLDAHFRDAGAGIAGIERAAKAHRWRTLLVAVFCVALGFAVLALVAMYRLG